MRHRPWTGENKDIVALKVNSLRYNPLVRRLGNQNPSARRAEIIGAYALLLPYLPLAIPRQELNLGLVKTSE